MKVTRRKAELLAKAYVALHNEASEEYKAAFASIGARMWRADYCHPRATKGHAAALELAEAYMCPIRRGMSRVDFIRKVWGRMPYPLTVLDSWHHLPRFEAKREALREDVSRIHAKYQRKWRKLLSSLLLATR